MKLGKRLLIAVFAGFLINSLLIFVWGDAGLKRMKAIEEHRDKLIDNIENLENIHNRLIVERDALLFDESEIELRARTLGYYRDNEVRVILPGRDDRAGSRTLGTLIRQIPSPPGSRITFRVVFLSVFLAAFAGTFVWKRNGGDSQKR